MLKHNSPKMSNFCDDIIVDRNNHNEIITNKEYYCYFFQSKLYFNYLLFCILYSTTHATVDAVLAFSSAELGSTIGAIAGFILYIFYTISALIFAKPIVSTLGPKLSVFIGLTSLLMYVCFFFLAVILESIGSIVFIIGSIIGGCGAGILWTGQSTYYALNADLYSESESHINSVNIINFAAIFTACYLSLEALFKFLSTIIYISSDQDNNNTHISWQIFVFGFYALAAFISVVLFHFMIIPLYDSSSRNTISDTIAITTRTTTISNVLNNDYSELSLEQNEDIDIDPHDTLNDNNINIYDHNDSNNIKANFDYHIFFHQSTVVMNAIYYDRKLLYMMPYQICFGITSGFINTFINGTIINNGIGKGYIGLLSGIAVLSAVILSYPYALISNHYQYGKYYIMITGSLCYLILGLTVLITSDSILSQWIVIVPYYILIGAARGIWENTNKAVIASYYIDIQSRETAYAAIYFSSGFSGAIGFLLCLFISSNIFAMIIVTISIIALVCYHLSTIC